MEITESLVFANSILGLSRLCPSKRLVLSAGLLVFATPAIAEVSDKVLSIPGMWIQAVSIGGLAILAGWFRWWLGAAFMILPVVVALSTLGLRNDPDLGPAIIEEQGLAYFQNFYASALLAALMVITGMWIGWRRKRHSLRGGDNN